MAIHPKTIKVKPSTDSQGGFVLINEADFDPAKHERVEEKRGPGRPKKIATE